MIRKHRIQVIPEDVLITTQDGCNLMEALASHSFPLRSDCGGFGKCGQCTVELASHGQNFTEEKSCQVTVNSDLVVKIPEESLDHKATLKKSSAKLPLSFEKPVETAHLTDCGFAIDLGTTTIAIYLCSRGERKIISEMHLINPHGEYGADVMNRISAVGRDETLLQTLSSSLVEKIEIHCLQMLGEADIEKERIRELVVVGNPAMIHFLLAVNPHSIGVAPYTPAFYSARKTRSTTLGFTSFDVDLQTLPQVAGFIGGDIIAASLAAEMESQPEGTLLIDIGTNGELLLKGKRNYFATSCATGPAFEGASISCGMQAFDGAIEHVRIQKRDEPPFFRLIGQGSRPLGICGSGVISAAADLYRHGLLDHTGSFMVEDETGPLQRSKTNGKHYILWQDDEHKVSLSQQDIRSIQLGKGALSTGIEFLLRKAGYEKPRKIIVAGAFGAFLEKSDILVLGLIPQMEMEDIEIGGNMAGAGAVMALCDRKFLQQATSISEKIEVINLAEQQGFQSRYLENLYFPLLSIKGVRMSTKVERFLNFC